MSRAKIDNIQKVAIRRQNKYDIIIRDLEESLILDIWSGRSTLSLGYSDDVLGLDEVWDIYNPRVNNEFLSSEDLERAAMYILQVLTVRDTIAKLNDDHMLGWSYHPGEYINFSTKRLPSDQICTIMRSCSDEIASIIVDRVTDDIKPDLVLRHRFDEESDNYGRRLLGFSWDIMNPKNRIERVSSAELTAAISVLDDVAVVISNQPDDLFEKYDIWPVFPCALYSTHCEGTRIIHFDLILQNINNAIDTMRVELDVRCNNPRD